MNNNQNYNGWILCRSKRFPDKFYYFNILNGEAAWSLADTEKNLIVREDCIAEKSNNYPEPEGSPIVECHLANMYNEHQKSKLTDSGQKFSNRKFTSAEPVFGQVVFPKYVSNVIQCTPNIIWEPNKIAPDCHMKFCLVDRATQTFVSKRDISIQTSENFCCCFSIPEDKRKNMFFISPPAVNQNKQVFNQNMTSFSSFQKIKECNNTVRRVKIKEPIIKNITKTNSTSFQTLPKTMDNQFKPEFIKFVKSSETNKNMGNNFFISESKLRQGFKRKTSVPPNIFKPSEKNQYISGNNDTDKEGNKFSLDMEDLRVLLNAKKRKAITGCNLSEHTGGKKIKTAVEVPKKTTLKKQVSFKDVDFDDGTIYDERNKDENDHVDLSLAQQGIPIIHILRMSAKPMMRKDIWYIAVDTIVLLEEFDFIDSFVQKDEKCRLLVTRAVRSDIEAMSSGNSCGRQRVFVARQIARKLMNPPLRFVLQPPSENNDSSDNLSIDNILSCCLRVIGENFHVVLVANDTNLLAKAKSVNIPCCKFQDIKDTINTKQVTFDFNKISRTTDTTKVDFTNDHQSYSNNCSDVPVNVFKKVLFGNTIESKAIRRNDIRIDGHESDSLISDIGREIKHLDIKERKLQYFQKPQSNKTVKEITFYKNHLQFQNTFDTRAPCTTRNIETVLKNKIWSVTSKGTQTTRDLQNCIENALFDSDGTVKKKNAHLNKKYEQNNNKMERIKKCDLIIDRLLNFQSDIPNSNTVINHRLSEIDKIFLNEVSMKEHLERFSIKDNVIEKKIKHYLTEWLCSFRQIMEDTLSDVLRKKSPYVSTALTLVETIDRIGQEYREHSILEAITEKLSNLILPYVDENGNFGVKVEPSDFMCMIAYSFLLIKNLKIILPQCTELVEAEELLDIVVQKIKDPTPEPTLPDPSEVLNRNDMEECRLDFVKDPSMIIDYLKQHFPQYKSYKGTSGDEHSPHIERRHNSNGNEETKVFRTYGKNVKLIKIDKKKSITVVNSGHKNNKDSDIKRTSNDTILMREKNRDVKTKNVEHKVIRDFKETRPFTELINKTKQKDDIVPLKVYKTKTDISFNNKIMVNAKEKNTKEVLNVKSDFNDKKICDNKNNYDRSDIRDNNYNCDNHSLNKVDKNDEDKSVSEWESVSECGKSQDIITPQNKGMNLDRVLDDSNDSGIDIDGAQAYSLGKCFLSELSTTFHTIYQFINDSRNEICDDELVDERKTYFHEVVDRMHKHLNKIIDTLKRITDRESNEDTALKAFIQKAGFLASTDKRMTNYRQVVKKCIEQALYLQKALKLTVAITDTSFERLSTVDSESISASIQYLNVFEQ